MKKSTGSKAIKENNTLLKAALALLIIFVIIIFSLIISNNVAADAPALNKIYSSVKINEGDSLWSIASIYHDESVSIDNYIEELRHINSIENDGALKAGNYITIYTF